MKNRLISISAAAPTFGARMLQCARSANGTSKTIKRDSMKARTSLCYAFAVNLFLAAGSPVAAQQTWGALGSGLSSSVDSLHVLGGVLYAGGTFHTPGQYIAQWNGTAWTAVGTGGPGGPVYALAALYGNLYVGGDLGSANPNWMWDGSTWTMIGGASSSYAYATFGGKLYASGDYGGGTGNAMLYYDPVTSSWGQLGANGSLPSIVYAIGITADGSIYAGGSTAGAAFLRKWNGSSWDTVTGAPTGGSGIYALTAYGNDLYVGGNFTTVGSGIAVRGLAKLSGSTWSAVGGTPPWLPSDTGGSTVRAIAWNGSSQMYVTGYLPNSTLGSTMNHIFLLQNGSWSTTVPSPGLYKQNGTISGYALAVDRYAGKVYVGGSFDSAGGVTATLNVAVWNDFRPYTLSDMGTLSGGSYSYGMGLFTSTSYGLRPGAYSQVNVTGTGLRDHACYYLDNFYGLIDIGGINGSADNSYANGGNDSDTIVGYSDYLGNGAFQAFRWTSSAGFVVLNPFSGGNSGKAQAINHIGDIVGFCRNSSGVDRATLWVSGSNNGEDLWSFVGVDPAYASYAYGVNKDGYIVGKSKTTGNVNYHAYRTLKGSKINQGTDLGTFGGNQSIAYGINDSREIVGSAQDSAQNWYAFIAAPDSTIGTAGHNLGPGHAYAINNFSQVVGGSDSYAFIWDNTTGGYKNLNDLIPSGGGLGLSAAYAISDTGVITGWGWKSIGGGYQAHGFRLDP